MRRKTLIAAAIASLVAAGPALAAGGGGGEFIITEWMDLGSGLLGANEFFERDFLVTQSPDADAGAGLERVVGFEVRWDYDEPVPDDSWASDVQVIVTAPTGEDYIVGGLTNEPQADERWSFQGVVSDGPGRYGDSGEDIFLPWMDAPLDLGLYNVLFTNDWAGDTFPNEYRDAQVRFYKVVPTPGALVLLGISGIAGRRRRRR